MMTLMGMTHSDRDRRRGTLLWRCVDRQANRRADSLAPRNRDPGGAGHVSGARLGPMRLMTAAPALYPPRGAENAGTVFTASYSSLPLRG